MSFSTFDDYWLAYLRAHSKPATRVCHYIGTALGLFLGGALGLFVDWRAFLVLGVIG